MRDESNDSSFASFDPDQHRSWNSDRVLRQRVPLAHAWRGCLGLAMLLGGVERTEYPTDRHALLPNACVRWMAVRDLPRDRSHATASSMSRPEACRVDLAMAELRYGMPLIDFTGGVCRATHPRLGPTDGVRSDGDAAAADRAVPCQWGDVTNPDRRAVEGAVIDRLQAAMTRFACCAVDRRGRPLRRAWAAVRPGAWAERSPTLPGQWMPRAYLAFGRRHAAPLQAVARAAGLTVDSDAGIVLYPAERVGQVAGRLAPVGLWWDLQPCANHLEGQLEAAVFPPIPLAGWDRLKFALPGEVLLDARVAGPPRPIAMTRPLPTPAKSSNRPVPRPALAPSRPPALSMAG